MTTWEQRQTNWTEFEQARLDLKKTLARSWVGRFVCYLRKIEPDFTAEENRVAALTEFGIVQDKDGRWWQGGQEFVGPIYSRKLGRIIEPPTR